MRRIFISYLPTPGSQIYKDAVILSKVVQSKAADCVTALAGRQSSGGRQVFSAEIDAKKYESDEDHDMKDDYPDCHEIISEPIDMNIIERNELSLWLKISSNRKLSRISSSLRCLRWCRQSEEQQRS